MSAASNGPPVDSTWQVLAATPADAGDVAALTRAVFSAYADLVPEPSSLRESVSDVERELGGAGGQRGPGGLVVRDRGGRLVGVARLAEHSGGLWVRRVAVDAGCRGRGVGGALLDAAEDVARSRGQDRLRVGVRLPLRDVQGFWIRRGFHQAAVHDYWVELARRLGVEHALATPEDTEALGRRLAGVLRAGDLVVLSGELGAGKTTLVRGLGVGLGVRGAVTSPTFVIARVHPSKADGPALVHVDAYRLGGILEVDDLDLDASLEESVTVVEWGEGKVERLVPDRLEVAIRRGHGVDDEARVARVRAVGERWSDVELR